MLVGNNIKQLEHVRYLANQAKDEQVAGLHSEMGFNFRMTNIEAALGLAQMERIDGFLLKKKTSEKIYRKILGNLPGVSFQQSYAGAVSSGWLTCIKVDGDKDIGGLMETLGNKNVPTRRVFMPVHEMPYLKQYAKACPNASEIYDRGLCLPSSCLNEDQGIEETAVVIKEVLNG